MKLSVLLSILFAEVLSLSIGDVKGSSLQNRIAGGVVASPNQFPYQVGLEMEEFEEGSFVYFWCGGSLISDRIVLTAAHCVYNVLSVNVMLGTHNRHNSEELGRIIFKVSAEHLFIHESYKPPPNFENDIALIYLPNKVTLNSKIQTINLPRRSQKSDNFEGVTGIISGWGSRGDTPAEEVTYKLQYVPRKVVASEKCEYFYGPYDKDSQICVDGSDKKSACPGDSGGPLAIQETDGSKIVIGLASYERSQGCQKNFPVSYTRITAYLDWISDNTGIKLRE